MKLNQLIELEFDNIEHVSKKEHQIVIRNSIDAYKKEVDYLDKTINNIFSKIHKIMHTKYPMHPYSNINEITDIPEIDELYIKTNKWQKRKDNIINKINVLKNEILKLKYAPEDTTIDSAIGIPNPERIAVCKGGPAYILNPYFYPSSSTETDRFAGDPNSSTWPSSIKAKQYQICVDLLKRHYLSRMTRKYSKGSEFIVIGNNGNFVWTVFNPGYRFAVNDIYINGHKVPASTIFRYTKDIPLMDKNFTDLMNR